MCTERQTEATQQLTIEDSRKPSSYALTWRSEWPYGAIRIEEAPISPRGPRGERIRRLLLNPGPFRCAIRVFSCYRPNPFRGRGACMPSTGMDFARMPQTIAQAVPFATGSHAPTNPIEASNPLTVAEQFGARNVLGVLTSRTLQIHANMWFHSRK